MRFPIRPIRHFLMQYLARANASTIHLPSVACPDNYSAKTHVYMVEYLKPTPGHAHSMLNVILNRKVDAQTAESVLREEIQRIVRLLQPKVLVQAFALTETDLTPGSEEMIHLSDGSESLFYSPKTKQTQTEKQFNLSRQTDDIITKK